MSTIDRAVWRTRSARSSTCWILSGMARSSDEDLAHLVGELVAAQLRQVQPQQVRGGDLREERLGRRHRDLRAGVRVEDRVRLTRDGRAVGVHQRQHLGALLARVPDRHERVHGLAGLRHGDHERPLSTTGSR